MIDTKNIKFILLTSFVCFSLLLISELSVKSYNLFDFVSQYNVKLLVMFLLAELTFAMTIPLLYGTKTNLEKNPNFYIYIPLVIIILAFVLFYYSIVAFSILFLIFNVFHVNRQSKGFLILQVGVKKYC